MIDTKIFYVHFIAERGGDIKGFTEATSLAEAMKRIANSYPDIIHLYWIDEKEEMKTIPQYSEV